MSSPNWVNRLMEFICDERLWEGIRGDLEEIFIENVEEKGLLRARFIYILNALGFMRPKFFKSKKTQSNMKAIWTNYFITSLRSIRRNKLYFGINLLGLILSVSCTIYALIYIKEELAVDTTLFKSDDTFRLYKRYINVPENVDHLTSETSGMMGPTMHEEYPEVLDFTRLCTFFGDVVASNGDHNIVIENFYFADSTFLDFFNYTLIAGDPENVLNAPSTILLSESSAQLLFPDSDPIGQSIEGLNGVTFAVTGILADPSPDSHLRFDAVASWSTTTPGVGALNWAWMNNWLAQGIQTYVKLGAGVDVPGLVEKLPNMMKNHFEERADQYFLKLQPANEIYLFSDDINIVTGTYKGSFRFVMILGFSAFLILIIAIVNCINISLSKVSHNNLEIGVRKVMGSNHTQLVYRFISETLISTVLATIIGVLLLASMLPWLNQLTGKSIQPDDMLQLEIVLFLILFIIVLSLAVGLYPALVRASTPASIILRRGHSNNGLLGAFRKGLLGLQYAISFTLIISAIIISQQISYVKNKPLGFDKEDLIVLDVDNEIGEKMDVFEAKLLEHPNIQSITSSLNAIGHGSYSTTVFAEGRPDDFGVRIYAIDPLFIDTYKMNLVDGRDFLKNSTADSLNIIVNKTLVDFLGWSDPIGKRIKFTHEADYVTIIGVLEDFHYYPLTTSRIEPMILYLDAFSNESATVRIGNGDLAATLSHIESSWNELASRTPFDFFFVSNWFDGLYQKETQLFTTATLYSSICIFLSAMGLFGLTALSLQHRRKEISIRKVLGADTGGIVSMVNKQFLIIVVIGFILSIPIAYWATSSWLDQFAYRINIEMWAFIIGGSSVIVASMLITTLLSMNAALVNPSDSLNRE